MSLTLLKYNAQVLLEVSQNYEKLLAKRGTVSGEEADRLEIQIKNLKSQILFLLTAIKKARDQENV